MLQKVNPRAKYIEKLCKNVWMQCQLLCVLGGGGGGGGGVSSPNLSAL